ncbi:hypothetical protein Taro_038235 [Colocasia esculenta]|uniref:Protein kinase domain-containing protein n=1 Tax=Colocasia esculenta TaxID=4460 RepID=A0A843W2V0_COLES|nr:hypothetical protein [Colocasia esculenta]
MLLPPPPLALCTSSTLQHLLVLLLLVPHYSSFVAAAVTAAPRKPSDTDALTIFRLKADTHGILAHNWSTPDACSGRWRGVACSLVSGRVTSLSLPTLDLRGPLDPLAHLDQLRALDLRGNRLNGTLAPAIPLLLNLKLLYLSRNDLSGEIPAAGLARLRRLVRLDLSDNSLAGPVPGADALANLGRVLTLRLQDNLLSGEIPDVVTTLPKLKDFNVSNNELSGKVPDAVRTKFGYASYAGNAGLCGSCSSSVRAQGMPPRSSPSVSPIVPSTPSSTVSSMGAGDREKNGGRQPNGKVGDGGTRQLSPGTVAGIAVGAAMLFLVVTSFFLTYYCCRRPPAQKAGEDKERNQQSSRRMIEGKKQNKRDLKRLKDANPCGRKEFEGYMDVVGCLRHPNLVRLRAYYYAKQEKLLVYDYLPNGTLFSLLHGSRGRPRRTPLDWTTRVSLVMGAARGLARIHEQYSAARIPHGNIKSSNILLDKNGGACISDFGLALLLNSAHATARLGGYRAPEQAETKTLSQEADVYGFGVLLLEVLTGRAPSQYHLPAPKGPAAGAAGGDAATVGPGINLPEWVRSVVREEWTAEVFDGELMRYKNIEEEMVAMLHVAMACVATQPEERPRMDEVVKMLGNVHVDISPLVEDDPHRPDDDDSSRASFSPSVVTTDPDGGRLSC